MRRLLLALGIAGLALSALPAHSAAQSLADYDYEHLGFRGVGVDLGLVWPDKVGNTAQLGLRVDLGYLGPGIRIIPSITYWQSDIADAELDTLASRLSRQLDVPITGEDLGSIQWSDLALSVDGQLVWRTPARFLTFAGLGLGFHALNGKGPAIDDTFVEDLLDSVTAAAAVLGGFEFEPTDQLRVYAEARYTVMNSVRFGSARVGVQFMFRSADTVEVGALPPPSAETRAR
jgi:opacity protein-like surface antigen